MSYLLISLIAPFVIYIGMAVIGFVYALFHVPAATNQAFGSVTLGIRLALRWFALFWIGLAVEIVGTAIAPIVLLFANHQTGRLPAWFHWMETQDALLPGYPGAQGFAQSFPTSWFAYYWQSLCWLCRNRVYRFATETMGILCTQGEPREQYGNPSVNEGPPAITGQYLDITRHCFECRAVFVFCGRYWDLRVGYKMNWVRNKTGYAQHVFRVLPAGKVIDLVG
jgi:hypothetical protein